MKKILILAGLFLLATGCLKTRGELSDGDEKKAAQTQIQTLQKQKADADADLMNFDQQIRTLNGRIEALENQQDQLLKQREDSNLKMAELEAKVKTLGDGIVQLTQEIENAKSAPPAASREKKSDKSEKSLFDEAEDYYAEKEWKKAISAYQKYREAQPKGEHVPAATYKIGASLQELKMNKEARVFFEEVLEKWPKSKPARAASFRLNQLKKK